jgi:hypothetical protein
LEGVSFYLLSFKKRERAITTTEQMVYATRAKYAIVDVIVNLPVMLPPQLALRRRKVSVTKVCISIPTLFLPYP